MKPQEDAMLNQMDVFTLKLQANAGYLTKYGLTPQQATDSRNDYLWFRYSATCTSQFEQEFLNRSAWKKKLRDGPQTTVAAQVPGVGSEFVAPNVPAVPDGVLIRWRALVNHIKNHRNYDVADGIDLGIEAVETPAQQMTPTASFTTTNGFTVKGRVFKDGHEAYVVYSRRGEEAVFTKLGVFTRATFTDARPPLSPGEPESRQYQLQYVDGDEPVGEMSSTYSVLLSGAVAA